METLIKFETSKLAKEKGFFQGNLLYKEDGEIWKTDYIGEDERRLFSATSQSTLQKYLRENHFIDIEIKPKRVVRSSKSEGYLIHIMTPKKEAFPWDLGNIHATYEDALEVALYESLKLIEDVY